MLLPNFNSIKIIIGLGNPDKYKNTYHNIGKLALEYLIKKLKNNIILNKNEKLFDYYLLNLNNKQIYLILPHTFMNESGKAVFAVIKKFKVEPENILIIHDENDLNIGEFKYSFNSGSAGHHGVESIFNYTKSKKFWRLRIGINNKNQSRSKAEKIVLKKITPDHKKIFYCVFDKFIEKLTENTLPSGDDLIFASGKSTDEKN